jgi:hypothetical protein
MFEIRVGEQQIGRVRARHALRQGPQLAAPARGARRALDDGQTRIGETAGYGGGAVRAAVIDQDDADRARIVLRQKRAQARLDRLRLIARRHDDGHRRRRIRQRGRQHLSVTPEHAVAQQQIYPHGQGKRREQDHAPAWNQATASRIASIAGRGA